jgi:hypothetical protein
MEQNGVQHTEKRYKTPPHAAKQRRASRALLLATGSHSRDDGAIRRQM